MRDGDVIFVKTDYIEQFAHELHPDIGVHYVLGEPLGVCLGVCVCLCVCVCVCVCVVCVCVCVCGLCRVECAETGMRRLVRAHCERDGLHGSRAAGVRGGVRR